MEVPAVRAQSKVVEGVYVVGGPGATDPDDCLAYLVDCESELTLIDSGLNIDVQPICENIRALGLEPRLISTLIITHFHADHIGGAASLVKSYGCKVYAHELDAEPIEKGDQRKTGAVLYGVKVNSCRVNFKLKGSEGELKVGSSSFRWIHTPGHTPGSISILLKTDEGNVLFAQDVHGPFSPVWGSDVEEWGRSMRKLLEMKFHVLAEGHSGIFVTEETAKTYIKQCLAYHGQE